MYVRGWVGGVVLCTYILRSVKYYDPRDAPEMPVPINYSGPSVIYQCDDNATARADYGPGYQAGITVKNGYSFLHDLRCC